MFYTSSSRLLHSVKGNVIKELSLLLEVKLRTTLSAVQMENLAPFAPHTLTNTPSQLLGQPSDSHLRKRLVRRAGTNHAMHTHMPGTCLASQQNTSMQTQHKQKVRNSCYRNEEREREGERESGQ